jgi:hypothetical protein
MYRDQVSGPSEVALEPSTEPLPLRDLSLKQGAKIKISVGSGKTRDRSGKRGSEQVVSAVVSNQPAPGDIIEEEWGDFTG